MDKKLPGTKPKSGKANCPKDIHTKKPPRPGFGLKKGGK